MPKLTEFFPGMYVTQSSVHDDLIGEIAFPSHILRMRRVIEHGPQSQDHCLGVLGLFPMPNRHGPITVQYALAMAVTMTTWKKVRVSAWGVIDRCIALRCIATSIANGNGGKTGLHRHILSIMIQTRLRNMTFVFFRI